MDRPPAEEQAQLVADVIAWRFAGRSWLEQQAKIAQLGPGMQQMMCEGWVGLPLLIFCHVRRMLPSRWLTQRDGAAFRRGGKVAGVEDS